MRMRTVAVATIYMPANLDDDTIRALLDRIDTVPLGDLLQLLVLELGASDYVDAHARLLREHAAALLRDRLNNGHRR